MIISHKHRYVFFAIPKTGTHAVRQALREQLGDEDVEQVGLFVQKRFPYPEFRDIQHGHLSAMQIRPVLGDEVFSSYRKFAFVRNPFDRFVSYCAFMARTTPHFDNEPLRYMKYIIRDARPTNHILFQPQHTFVVDRDGVLQLDMIGRTETMQQSYDEICAKLGFPSAPLEKVNTSRRRAYQEYYDSELVSMVSDLYRKDLDMFGYTFE